MSWIDDEFVRRQKEGAAKRAALAEKSNRENADVQLLATWKRLVGAIESDVVRFNEQSEKKVAARVVDLQLDLHWQGKPAPLLTLKLDAKNFQVLYSLPSEAAKKLKIVLNEYSDPYLWMEGEGQVSFEKASELLLKPILFP